MFALRRPLAVVAGSILWATSGCLFVPGSQFNACRDRYQLLAEQSRAQETQISNLDAHRRKIENQLLAAEDQLAALDKQNRGDRQRLVNYEQERDELYQRIAGGRTLPESVSERLAELSQRYPSLHYDERYGVSKLDTDVLFESGQARLGPDARRLLGEFAKILRTADADTLKVLVVGHTDNRPIEDAGQHSQFPNNWHLSSARALRVAEYLRASGVAKDRMGVAAFSKHQPVAANGSPRNRQQNRRVEIFIVSEDVPIVGWTETLTSVYP